MKHLKWSWAEITVVLLILVYIVWFSFLSIRQHNAFMTGGLDLGNVDQALWNTSRGRFLQMTTMDGQWSRLGLHAEPILLFLVPLYWIIPDPRTLLVVQTVILAAGAWAAFRLAQWKLHSSLAGVVFAAVYLMAPVVQGANLFQFHAVTFTATFLLFAVYYMLRGQFVWFSLFAILAVLCKEEISLIVMLMGVYFWFTQQDRRGIWLSAGIFVWFLAANLLIIPAFSPVGENIHYARYARVGGGLSGMVHTLLTNPLQIWSVATEPAKLDYLMKLLFPVGFLSLFSPIVLALALPSLAVNILSDHEPMYVVDLQHYSASIWPFVLASAVLGIAVVVQGLRRVTRVSHGFLVAVLIACVVIFSLFNHLLRGKTPLSVVFSMPEITSHDQLAARFMDQIPADAVVSAQNPFVSHLSHRPHVYIFPRVDNDTEWVLLDIGGGGRGIYPFDNWAEYHLAANDILHDETFGVVDAADGYLLLQQGASARPLPEDFYSFAWADNVPQDSQVMVKFGSAATLVGLEIEKTGADAVAVRTWWEQGDQPEQEQSLGTALADFDCPQDLSTQWSTLPVMRWYHPKDWKPDAIVWDQTYLALPPDTPAHCVGIQLAVVDANESPIQTEAVELESIGRWQMAAEDEILIITLEP